MLKKMRWRFIGAAMIAFTAVVLTLLCCINIWNYWNMTARLDNTLAVLYEIDEKGLDLVPQQEKPPQGHTAPFSGEMPYMIRFFSVQYDENGKFLNINQDYIASVSEDEALNFADHVLETGRERGFHDVYRFLVNAADGKTTVIFLNAEKELLAARDLLATTLVVSGLCLVVVFILVLLLAGRAVKPYMRNLEMQRQFITNAGHELKTPLTAISTSADVLAMEYEGDEWVQNIQVQSGKLSKLIANLITLSRLDEERPSLEKSEFSLSDALWETSDSFMPLIQARGKLYSQSIEDNLQVTSDRAAVQQMVSILLDNAVKYSLPYGRISLEAFRKGRRTVIEVSNTCGEIDYSELKHIFDRFYRVDKSHSETVSGSGIGLSIARATAEALGGKICAEMSGDTIRFRITL